MIITTYMQPSLHTSLFPRKTNPSLSASKVQGKRLAYVVIIVIGRSIGIVFVIFIISF
jgi:hypothetical protein